MQKEKKNNQETKRKKNASPSRGKKDEKEANRTKMALDTSAKNDHTRIEKGWRETNYKTKRNCEFIFTRVSAFMLFEEMKIKILRRFKTSGTPSI